MSRRQTLALAPSRSRAARLIQLTVGAALGLTVGACSSESGESPVASGGTSAAGAATGTGGSGTSTAGSTGTSGSAGSSSGASTGGSSSGGSSNGGSSSGGAPSDGGASGSPSTSGAGGSATGGSAGAGGTASGGTAGASGGTSSGGGGSTAGGSAGAGGSGSCQKGSTKGNEVLFIGESFVAASTIPEETTKLAKAAGSLKDNENYVDKSVSGTWIGNGASNSIPNQYKNNSTGVRFVLMNGGGNDCWQGGKESDRTNALNAAKQLFKDMQGKVEKVVYFFYPNPVGTQYASLTSCLDLLRPAMKTLCEEQGSPKCYWVDLREAWTGHPEYTSDGIHVATPGNAPTAAAIFKSMQDNCVAP